MKDFLLEVYNTLFDYYGPQNWWPGESFDEIVIGAILTQNTNWINVEKAINNLKENDLCSLESIIKLPITTSILPTLIKPSGYYNIKAKRLINTAQTINYPNFCSKNDNLDTLREKLLSINGIGPETADSILLYAYSQPIFVIDTYTKRLFSRIGLVDEKTSYQNFQKLFMENLEHNTKLFNEYHALIVVHCKNKCKVKPICSDCCLGNKKYENSFTKSITSLCKSR